MKKLFQGLKRITLVFAVALLTLLAMKIPDAQAATIYDNFNIYAVYNGPSTPTVFSVPSDMNITKITTYHYNNGSGSTPGTISLRHSDSTVYGPWTATGSAVPNLNWLWNVYPNASIKAGSYTVIDSNTATWSYNSTSGNSGFVLLEGDVVTATQPTVSSQCSYFNETFTGAASNTWSNYNATWLIKNGKLNASAITSGKTAQAITAFSPAAYFTVDVDTEAVSLAQTNGSYGLYVYTTGTTYLSVNGKFLDGIAVFIYPNSTAQITAWDITNNAWYGSDTLTLSSAPTSIGLEFSSTGVTARINKQSTSLKFSAPINTPSIFNKIMLMASGSGFLFTGGTEVNFDNVCADPLVTAVAQFTLTTTKSGTGSGTVASSPPGISCGNDCSEKYNSGTQVTLTATANSGSTFSGWSGGGCSGTGTCSVTLTADTTVTAGFATSGGSTGGSCTATLDQSLKLNIPIIKYTDPVLGSIYLWTDMTYTANSSKVSFKLSDYGIIPNVSGYTCTMSTLDSDLTIHVADLSYGGKSYWLKLTYDTSLSSGSNLYFYAADYGTGTGGSTTPTTSTIYDSLPGTWTEAYSLGQTTCVGSTADTTYESVVTNSTNEVSGVKHVIKTNNANGTTSDYTVTDADSPFKMQSVPKAASNGSCTWTYTISFELTSSSAGQLSGTCTNSITNKSKSGCTNNDDCTFTQHIEMTKK